jgi:hypothetical protein
MSRRCNAPRRREKHCTGRCPDLMEQGGFCQPCGCPLREVSEGMVFQPFRLGRARAVFGGFPVPVGKGQKGHKRAFLGKMGRFRKVNENVICASPATSAATANPSMPMVCASHLGDSPGLRRPSAVHAQGHEGIAGAKANLISHIISELCVLHTGSTLFSVG